MNFTKIKTATLLFLAINSLPSFSNVDSETHQLLEQYSQQLDQHELSLSTMAFMKNHQKALNAQVDSGLKEKNLLIQEYQKLMQTVRDKKLSFSQRMKVEFQKRSLSNTMQEKNEMVNALEEQLAEKKFKYENLQTLFKEQERNFHHTVEGLTSHIEQLNSALERKGQTIAGQISPEQKAIWDDYFSQLSMVRMMKGELQSKNQSILFLKEELGMKDQTNQNLNKVNRKLSEALTHAENKIEFLSEANKSLNNKLIALESDYSSLSRYTTNLEKDLTITTTKLQGEIAAIQTEFQQYKIALGQNPQKGRYPASVVSESLAFAKDDFSLKLRKELEQARITIQSYSNERFAIVLDDQYLFFNDQSELGTLNKIKLNALITIITEEIFGEDKDENKLVSVDIVGHSSPRYRSAYINPTDADQEAYAHNLKLSLDRAQRVANTLLSDDFQDFPHKKLIRRKIRVVGKSFSNPVSKREVASQNEGHCGPYDCQKSRRVEIIFQLESNK